MLIFGHEWVESPKFIKVFNKNDIKNLPAGDIALLEPLNVSIDLAHYCKENNIPFAVTVNNIRDAVFVNAIKGNYIISEHELAITIQKIAEDYIFDAKILVLIDSEKQLDTMIRFSIDGVIFPSAIVQP